MELKAPEVKGTARRDKLHAIQNSVQKRWDELKINETSRKLNADGTEREKFMVTFPYPYMNGRLHLGHAFSLTKVGILLSASVVFCVLCCLLCQILHCIHHCCTSLCSTGRVHCSLPTPSGQERHFPIRFSLHRYAYPGSCQQAASRIRGIW